MSQVEVTLQWNRRDAGRSINRCKCTISFDPSSRSATTRSLLLVPSGDERPRLTPNYSGVIEWAPGCFRKHWPHFPGISTGATSMQECTPAATVGRLVDAMRLRPAERDVLLSADLQPASSHDLRRRLTDSSPSVAALRRRGRRAPQPLPPPQRPLSRAGHDAWLDGAYARDARRQSLVVTLSLMAGLREATASQGVRG